MLRKKKKTATDIKRELKAVELELKNVIRIQWKYLKQMMRFGIASWIFGLTIFFFILVIFYPEIILGASLIAVPLLILAAAVPPIVTAIRVRRFDHKIKRLELIRHGLLIQYEKAVLERIGEEISTVSKQV